MQEMLIISLRQKEERGEGGIPLGIALGWARVRDLAPQQAGAAFQNSLLPFGDEKKKR